MTLIIKLAFILFKEMFVKTKRELFYFLLIPTVNQINIFEFFLLSNIKLENFLITLISKMLTLYSNNFDL